MLSKDNLNYARRPARRVACWTRFVSPVHLWLIYNFEHCGTLWPVDHVQVVCICSLDYILRVLWSCISCISCILCQFLVFAILQSTEFLDVCDCCRTSSQTRTSLTRLNGAVLESKVGKTAEIELRWNECSHKMSQLQTAFELHCLIYWGSVRARDHSPIFRNQSQKRKSSTWISLMGSQKENCSHQNHPALQYSKPKSCKLSLCHFSCPLTLPLCPSLSLSLYLTLCNSLTGTMLRCHPNIYSYHQDSSCWLERTTMIFCCASLGQHRFQLPKICIWYFLMIFYVSENVLFDTNFTSCFGSQCWYANISLFDPSNDVVGWILQQLFSIQRRMAAPLKTLPRCFRSGNWSSKSHECGGLLHFVNICCRV